MQDFNRNHSLRKKFEMKRMGVKAEAVGWQMFPRFCF